MSLTFPPISLINGVFDVTVSGRTITPVGLIQVAGRILYPNPTVGPATPPSAGSIAYDLAIIAIDGSTYGLAIYDFGTTPIDIYGVWFIGTVNDFPASGSCQVLLNSSLAFQSDQYVAVQQDGLHVKAFAQVGVLYGNLVVEGPSGGIISITAGGSTSAYVQTALMDLNLMAFSIGTNVNIASLKGNTTIQTGNPGPGLGAHVGSFLVTTYGDISLTAGVNSPFVTGAINMLAQGNSTWHFQSGSLTLTGDSGITIQDSDPTGLTLRTTGTNANSGPLAISTAGTAGISITTLGVASLNMTATAASTWKIGSGSGLLTIQNAGTGGITVDGGSGGITLTQSGSAMAFTNTGRAINFTGSTLTMHGGITADTTGIIASQGSSAFLIVYDRAGAPGNYAGWYRDSTTLHLNSLEAGDLWAINTSTGQITQGAWTNLTYSNSWVTATGYQAGSYRKTIMGQVMLRGSVMSGAINTILATLPAGFRPSVTLPFAVSYYNGTSWGTATIYVDSAGALTSTVSGTPAGAVLSLNNISFDTL